MDDDIEDEGIYSADSMDGTVIISILTWAAMKQTKMWLISNIFLEQMQCLVSDFKLCYILVKLGHTPQISSHLPEYANAHGQRKLIFISSV